MKIQFFLTIFILSLGLVFPLHSFAQGVMGNNMMGRVDRVTQNDNGLPAEASAQAGHTAREEAEGKEVWEKLQSKELKCVDLSNDDFGALGEYFMGQMMGDSHEAMNDRLTQMLGSEGEEQMHIAMGKRMSGCEPNAPMPQDTQNGGMMSMMMNMMMGSAFYGMKEGGGNSMMSNFAGNPIGTYGWGFGWIFMILFWGLIILGIVALVKWTANQGKNQTQDRSALDILKERYAKGEIDKKEFEEKKKDLK